MKAVAMSAPIDTHPAIGFTPDSLGHVFGGAIMLVVLLIPPVWVHLIY